MNASDTAGDHVLIERTGDGIAIVTLNRPEVLNALSERMRIQFTEALEGFNQDASVRAVVLTGAGERSFSAGQDLIERLGRLYQSVRALDKPSVVALNGIAAGFGLQTALHADVRIAHPGVRMGQPEVAAGIPSIVGMWIIKETVGLARAIELSLTCRLIPAEEALEWGMVQEVVPREEVLPRALAVARELAEKPAYAFALSKQRMRALTQPGYDETIRAAMRIQPQCYATGEPQRVAAEFLAARAAKKDRK